MEHEKLIARCYELAIAAGKKGYDTFGALLEHDGIILEEAENTTDRKADTFGHAEFNLVHKCANSYPEHILREAVFYTSCAPCDRVFGDRNGRVRRVLSSVFQAYPERLHAYRLRTAA